MALNALGLGLIFTARDLATPTMRRITGHFDAVSKGSEAMAARTTSAFKTIGIGAAVMIGGILGLAAINKVAAAAGRFDMALAKVGATMRATTAQMRLLERAAIEAGIKTQFSPDEAVAGLQNLAQAGFNATDAAKSLVPALDLAAGGQISVADATAVIVSSMKAYGVAVEDAGMAADQLLRITQMTQLSGRELRQGLANMARGALATKGSLAEMLPILGLVRDTGLDVSVAGTAVSSAMDFMARRSEEFADIGGKAVRVTDAQTGAFRPFLEIVLDTQSALEGYTDQAERSAKITKLFGRFGKTAYLAVEAALTKGVKNQEGVILRGAEAIAYLREQMANAGGTAAEFREKMLDTLEGQKILLKGTLQTLAITLGKPLAKVLKPVVNFITESINRFIRWFDALSPRVKEFIAGLLTGGFAVMTLVGALIAAKGVIALLGAIGITALAPFLLLLAKIALIGAIIVGVALLIKKAWETNFAGIREKVLPVLEKLFLAFKVLVAFFSKGGFSKPLRDELNKAENAGVKAFVVGVIKLWYRLKEAGRAFLETFEGFWDELSDMFKPVIDELASAFSELWESIKDIGAQLGLVDGTVNASEQSWGDFGSKIAQVAKIIIKAIAWVVKITVQGFTILVKSWAWLADAVAGAIEFWKEVDWGGIWDSVVGFFQDVGNAIAAVWTAIVGAVKAAINAVVNFFRERMAEMLELVISIGEKIPKRLRPAFISDFLREAKGAARDLSRPVQVFAEEERAPVITAPTYTPRTRAAAPSPAAAVASARTEAAAPPALVGAGAETFATQVQVFLDGEQVGEAVDKRKRDAAARGGNVVPVFAGGTR